MSLLPQAAAQPLIERLRTPLPCATTERQERRALWAPHSRATRPDLLPWDLALDWTLPVEELGRTWRRIAQATHPVIAPDYLQNYALLDLMGYDRIKLQRGRDLKPWRHETIALHLGDGVVPDIRAVPSEVAYTAFPDQLCSNARFNSDGAQQIPGYNWHEHHLVYGDFVLRTETVMQPNGEIETRQHAPEPRAQTEHGDVWALCGPSYRVDLIKSVWHAFGQQELRLTGIRISLCPDPGEAATELLPGRSANWAVDAWSGWYQLSSETPGD